MAQRFIVAIPQDGGVQLYPMKEWLRQNLGHVPEGTDINRDNSQKIARDLVRVGWQRTDSETEARLAMRGAEVESALGEAEDDSFEEAAEAGFALEHQLRDFLANNLHSIDVGGKRLRLHAGGVEFATDVGRIDILARDDAGGFYVFELKRARSPDAAVGQVARYMGWISETIGKGHPVHGIIVAKEISPGPRYAAQVMKNLSLFEYEVSFALKPATMESPRHAEPN
jgi:RecB family endonuclease NucS